VLAPDIDVTEIARGGKRVVDCVFSVLRKFVLHCVFTFFFFLFSFYYTILKGKKQEPVKIDYGVDRRR